LGEAFGEFIELVVHTFPFAFVFSFLLTVLPTGLPVW